MMAGHRPPIGLFDVDHREVPRGRTSMDRAELRKDLSGLPRKVVSLWSSPGPGI